MACPLPNAGSCPFHPRGHCPICLRPPCCGRAPPRYPPRPCRCPPRPPPFIISSDGDALGSRADGPGVLDGTAAANGWWMAVYYSVTHNILHLEPIQLRFQDGHGLALYFILGRRLRRIIRAMSLSILTIPTELRCSRFCRFERNNAWVLAHQQLQRVETSTIADERE